MLRILTTTLALTMAIPAIAQDLASLEATARANRTDGAAQTAFGIALIRAERFREADRVLRTAARLHDNTPEALFDVARVAFAQEDYRKSRAACRLLERRHRTHTLSHICRARAFLVWNRSGRAFEELEAADASHFETLLALGDAHRLRAAVDESEQAYRRAIAVDASRSEPHIGLGLLFSNARREQPAIAAFREAYRIDAGDPDVNYQLAIRVGGDEGRRLLQAAVATRPSWPDALVALADLELAAEDRTAARAHFEAALEGAPDNAAAHIGLGRILLAEGDAEAGEGELLRALELVPNSPEVALALGQLYESQQRNQEAFGQYRHAADLAPARPVGLLRAAALALRLNRDVLATGFLDRYLQGKPNSAPALELYGDAMLARHDRGAAQRYYERALRGRGEIDREAVQRKLAQARQRRERQRIQRATRRN